MVSDGTIYVGSQDRNLYAFDERTGSKLWSYEVGGGITGGAAVIGNIAYVASLDQNLYAIDTDRRKLKWTYETQGKLWSGPVLANGLVFVGSEDANVYAVDAETGELVWRYETGDEVIGRITLHEDTLLFNSYDGYLYALAASQGTLIWKARLRRGSLTRPSVSDGAVYTGAFDGRVYAFDVDTGSPLWTYWVGDAIWSSPVVDDGNVLVGADDGRLYAVDAADGTLRWSFSTDGKVRSSPAVSDGVAYFGSYDDGVYAVEVATGALAWRFSTGGDIRAVVVVNGAVYVGSRDEVLYAITPGIPGDTELSLVSTFVPTPAPVYVPLDPEETKDLLEQIRGWRALGGTRSTADGGTERISNVEEIFELFETAHFLLTGAPSRWIPKVLTRTEFQVAAIERRDPELGEAAAWCCERTDEGLVLVIKGSGFAHSAIQSIGHEAGHARQSARHPGQTGPRDSNVGALHEAQAFAFGAATIRQLSEYTGINAAIIPSYASQWMNDWVTEIIADIHNVEEQHNRGRCLLWSAVLNDPDLSGLKDELTRNGMLTADSLLRLHDHLVSVSLDKADDYVADLLDAFDTKLVRQTILGRIGSVGEEGFFERNEDAFLVP